MASDGKNEGGLLGAAGSPAQAPGLAPDLAASLETGPSGVERDKILSLLARFILGAVFLWAAAPKIASPLSLVETIMGYRLLPQILLAPAAIVLPFVELWAALAVLFGPSRLRRSGALLLGALLLVFMLAAAQGLLRGLDFECGCFGPDSDRRPGLLFFLEDVGLLGACLVILRLDSAKMRDK